MNNKKLEDMDKELTRLRQNEEKIVGILNHIFNDLKAIKSESERLKRENEVMSKIIDDHEYMKVAFDIRMDKIENNVESIESKLSYFH